MSPLRHLIKLMCTEDNDKDLRHLWLLVKIDEMSDKQSCDFLVTDWYQCWLMLIRLAHNKTDFGNLKNALTFCVSNINTNRWYKRSFAQISLLLLIQDRGLKLELCFVLLRPFTKYCRGRGWVRREVGEGLGLIILQYRLKIQCQFFTL